MDVLTLGPLEVPPLAVGAMFWGTRVPVRRRTTCSTGPSTAAPGSSTPRTTTRSGSPERLATSRRPASGEWIASRGRDRSCSRRRSAPGPPGRARGTDARSGSAARRSSIRRRTACAACAPTTSTSSTPTSTTRACRWPRPSARCRRWWRRGWARAFAASNLTADRLAEAIRATGERPRHVALQNRFTFLPPAPGTDFGRQVLLDEAVQAPAGPTAWPGGVLDAAGGRLHPRRPPAAGGLPAARLGRGAPHPRHRGRRDRAGCRPGRAVVARPPPSPGHPRHRCVPARPTRQRDHRGDDADVGCCGGRAGCPFPASWLVEHGGG